MRFCGTPWSLRVTRSPGWTRVVSGLGRVLLVVGLDELSPVASAAEVDKYIEAAGAADWLHARSRRWPARLPATTRYGAPDRAPNGCLPRTAAGYSASRARCPVCSASTASVSSFSAATAQSPSRAASGGVRAQRAASRRANPRCPESARAVSGR